MNVNSFYLLTLAVIMTSCSNENESSVVIDSTKVNPSPTTTIDTVEESKTHELKIVKKKQERRSSTSMETRKIIKIVFKTLATYNKRSDIKK